MAFAEFDPVLLSRIEDAGLNASAPPQQRWLDGWLVRFSPGKAKRARCINAVAPGRMPVADKLALAREVYREAGLELVLRITPFSAPESLDAQLEALDMPRIDDTRVMVGPITDAMRSAPVLPGGLRWHAVDGAAYAEAVGRLRGSPASQIEAHAQRLAVSPVPYEGFVIQADGDPAPLACGQFAREADLVGLYDVYTAEAARGRGLASLLCTRLLSIAAGQGARTVYLQVEADNEPARRIYHRLGLADAYAYHYRIEAPAAA